MSNKLTIDSQESILKYLQSSQIKVKLAVLNSIINFPQKVMSYIPDTDTTLVEYIYTTSLENSSNQLLKLYIQALLALDEKRGIELILLLWNKSEKTEELSIIYDVSNHLSEKQKCELGKKTLFSNVVHKSYLASKLLSNSIEQLNFKEYIRYLLITKPKEIQNIEDENIPSILIEELNETYKMQAIDAIRYLKEDYLKKIMKSWDIFPLSIKIDLAKIIFSKDSDNIHSIMINAILKKTSKDKLDKIFASLKDY